ncbi:hypothetical protein Syun_003459 [Stephania yunnanensis]|uniref:Uncharacterized protein n=1 Tax=Stephania yunnanensis TaxID=152371 RepID=A0AAP0L2U0_9MAGN
MILDRYLGKGLTSCGISAIWAQGVQGLAVVKPSWAMESVAVKGTSYSYIDICVFGVFVLFALVCAWPCGDGLLLVVCFAFWFKSDCTCYFVFLY